MTQSEIQYYVQKRREGWDHSRVRKELKNNGYSGKDLFYLMNEIDDIFVREIVDKSNLTVNNLSLRIIELIIGVCALLFGLFLLVICFIYGPGLLALIFGFSCASGGYYFSQRGLKGLQDIRKTARNKLLIGKSKDVLDD